jgi:hypothetical protein
MFDSQPTDGTGDRHIITSSFTYSPFITKFSIKIVRKSLEAIGKNKSVGPDSVSGEILNLGGEAIIP